jgi:hypothetical protein
VIVPDPVLKPLAAVIASTSVAVPPETGAVPRVVLPSLNVTAPVALVGVTVALRVVVPLRATEFGVAVTVVVVGIADTIIGVLPLDAAKLASPP